MCFTPYIKYEVPKTPLDPLSDTNLKILISGVFANVKPANQTMLAKP
jgi:hypothetical protein